MPTVVLSDFGSSMKFNTNSKKVGVGLSEFYASPQKRSYGRKTDVCSFGVIFLEVCMKIGGAKRLSQKIRRTEALGPV